MKRFLFILLFANFISSKEVCDFPFGETICDGKCTAAKRLRDNEFGCENGQELMYKAKDGSSARATSNVECTAAGVFFKDEPAIKLVKGLEIGCRVTDPGSVMTYVYAGFGALFAILVIIGMVLYYLRFVKRAQPDVEVGNSNKNNKAKAKQIASDGCKTLTATSEPLSGKSKNIDPSSDIVENVKTSEDWSSEKRRAEKTKDSIENATNNSTEDVKKGSKETVGKKKGLSLETLKKTKTSGSVEGTPKKDMLRKDSALKEIDKLNQRKGKLPVPNLAKCENWDDKLFEEILKQWMNFSINERIGFCEQMWKKMNGTIAVQFMRLFQNALWIETDRRVWVKLHETFRLLYAQCEAEYYMNICERMYQTVGAQAKDKLDKLGWQEKSTDSVDDAYIRYICADLVLFDCQTENIAKLFKTYEEKKFTFISPLRIAVWTRVVREDDLSNEKLIVQRHLFEEAKKPKVKLPTDDHGTRIQHLLYALSTAKDSNFVKEFWKKIVAAKDITPSDIVFVFKGSMIYPSTRKRSFEALMDDSLFHNKLPPTCGEYRQILRLFANTSVREAELQRIKDLVLADCNIPDDDKRAFDFPLLEKRLATFLKEVPILHSSMNKYLIEDRDFLVHNK